MGTLYERSHIPLNKWLLATHLMSASKKGMSAHQLWRMLGFGSYRTAWFMAIVIREGMRELFPEESGPLGGEGKTVEMDETFVGGLEKKQASQQAQAQGHWRVGKQAVYSLVERRAAFRSHHVPAVTSKNWLRSLRPSSTARPLSTPTKAQRRRALVAFMRNTSPSIIALASMFAATCTPNTIEGYFSILKRGIQWRLPPRFTAALEAGIWRNLNYLITSAWRLALNDAERTRKAVVWHYGQRLTYQDTNGGSHA